MFAFFLNHSNRRRVVALCAVFALCLVLVPLLASGCVVDGTGSGDVPLNEFAQATPRASDVELRLPSDPNPSGLVVGDVARYWGETYQVTRSVNGTVYVLLSMLEDLVSYPPTEIDENSATWGPYTPALEPTTFQLVVNRASEDNYNYDLMMRPRTSTDEADFVSVLTGESHPDARRGNFALDYTAFAQLHPLVTLRGQMNVWYQHADLQWRSVEMEFVDLQNLAAIPAMEPTDVTYRYIENDDTSGDFQFAYLGDVHQADAVNTGLEMVQTRSRWTASGSGRADVRVSSDEIGAALAEWLELDQDYVSVSECWDDNFLRTYYDEAPIHMTDDDGEPDPVTWDGPGQGALSDCPFQDDLFVDDDIAILL